MHEALVYMEALLQLYLPRWSPNIFDEIRIIMFYQDTAVSRLNFTILVACPII